MLSDGNNPNNVIVEDRDKEKEDKTFDSVEPTEHCPVCFTRTGGGRCLSCIESTFDFGR